MEMMKSCRDFRNGPMAIQCNVWHVLLVLGISCCCQQESAQENGSFEVG